MIGKEPKRYFYTALVAGLGAAIGTWLYSEIRNKYHVGFAGPADTDGIVSCIEGCLTGGGIGGGPPGGGRPMHHRGMHGVGGGGSGGRGMIGGPGGTPGGPGGPGMIPGPPGGGGGPGGPGGPMMGGGGPPGGPGGPGFAQPWQRNAPIPPAQQAADPWNTSYVQYPSSTYYVVAGDD